MNQNRLPTWRAKFSCHVPFPRKSRSLVVHGYSTRWIIERKSKPSGSIRPRWCCQLFISLVDFKHLYRPELGFKELAGALSEGFKALSDDERGAYDERARVEKER